MLVFSGPQVDRQLEATGATREYAIVTICGLEPSHVVQLYVTYCVIHFAKEPKNN